MKVNLKLRPAAESCFLTVFLTMLMIFIAAGGLVLSGCDQTADDNSPDDDFSALPIPDVPPGIPPLIPADRLDTDWWSLRHTQRSGAAVKVNQKIIFIGDSITHYWESTGADHLAVLNAKYGNRVVNLGFGGDRTQHVIWRLENGEFPAGINPEYVVLKIGTNNSNVYDPPNYTAAGIGEIIKIIHRNSPQTKILIFSLLPRGTGKNDIKTIFNFKTNEIIKNYDGYLNIQYVDIANSYLNADGSLKTELFTDNLHLSVAGYLIWRNKLTEIIGD